MSQPGDDSSEVIADVIGAGLPSGRLEELRPRLQALLADFAHLSELETPELEPLPVFAVAQAGDRYE